MDIGLAPAGITLESRFEDLDRPVLLTGIQALLRLLLEQRRLDRAAGLNTAALVSGYRGSPLGGLDRELWVRKKLMAEHDIRFEPGINEDLAATMLYGTQELDAFPGARVDGVYGMWYGKGPRRRPLRRRAALRQHERNAQARRRARHRRRRPRRALLDLPAPDRIRLPELLHPGAQPGLGAGCHRPRPGRLRHVPLRRRLGRAEDHRRNHGAGGHRHRPLGAPFRHPRHRAATARAELRPDPCTSPPTAPSWSGG